MTRRIVSFDYVLKNKAGDLLDSSQGGEPLKYVEGANQIIPGLESRLTKSNTGDKISLMIPAGEAYGNREEKLVVNVPRTELPSDKEVNEGTQFEVEIASGVFHPFVVTKLTASHVTLDGNHELAGVDLYFDIAVKEARTATEQEVQEAEALAAHSHEDHEHGDGCNH
jgi:FKBP-type peptidyl-prolyl cis-trans isomerase SlyD